MTKTPKEVFDETVKFLFEQKRPARPRRRPGPLGNSCRYRVYADDGTCLKCAFGYWIPDAHYSPDMESDSIEEIVDHLAFIDEDFEWMKNDDLLKLFEVLQAAHDDGDWTSPETLAESINGEMDSFFSGHQDFDVSDEYASVKYWDDLPDANPDTAGRQHPGLA